MLTKRSVSTAVPISKTMHFMKTNKNSSVPQGTFLHKIENKKKYFEKY